MSTPAEVQPKRRPGRPRSSDAVTDTGEKRVRIPNDERVGQMVPEPGCTGITFEDGRSYIVENGMIMERVA